MQATNTSTQTMLETILERIFAIRRITRRDQQLLMSTLLSKEGLNESDRLQIGRVFDALQRGLIKVVD
ncbi:hypothetical protein NIES4074_03460 [Cylindrospermum sp. NIES-4074]|jgi:hypothetical protein|nr:hypothetical protein NIES4074_03460 [Cylindrospermum sp. NIES-4074]